MASIVGEYLKMSGDIRPVLPDVHAGYFGIELNEQSLVPPTGSNPRIGKLNLASWFQQQQG